MCENYFPHSSSFTENVQSNSNYQCDSLLLANSINKSLGNNAESFTNNNNNISFNPSDEKGFTRDEAFEDDKLKNCFIKFERMSNDSKTKETNESRNCPPVHNCKPNLSDKKIKDKCTKSRLHTKNSPKKRKSFRLENKSDEKHTKMELKIETSELKKTTSNASSHGLSIAQVLKYLRVGDSTVDPTIFQWLKSNIKTKSVSFTLKFSKQFKAMRELNSYIESLPINIQDQWWNTLENTKYITPRFASGWQIIFGNNLPELCSLAPAPNFSFLKTDKRRRKRSLKPSNMLHDNNLSQKEFNKPAAQVFASVIDPQTTAKESNDSTFCSCRSIFKYSKAVKHIKFLKEICARFERERNSLKNLVAKRNNEIKHLREENKLLKSYNNNKKVKKDEIKKQKLNNSDILKEKEDIDPLKQDLTIVIPQKLLPNELFNQSNFKNQLEISSLKDMKVAGVLSTAKSEPNLVFEECLSVNKQNCIKSKALSRSLDVTPSIDNVTENKSLMSEISVTTVDMNPQSLNVPLLSSPSHTEEENNVYSIKEDDIKIFEQKDDESSTNTETDPSVDIITSSVSFNPSDEVNHNDGTMILIHDPYSIEIEDKCIPVNDIKINLKQMANQLQTDDLIKNDITKGIIRTVKICEEKLHDIQHYINEKNYKLNLYKREIIAIQTDLINNEMVLKHQLNENEILSKKYDCFKRRVSSMFSKKTPKISQNFGQLMISDATTSGKLNADTGNHSKLNDSDSIVQQPTLSHDANQKSSSILSGKKEKRLIKEEEAAAISQAHENLEVQNRLQQSLIIKFENEVKLLKETNQKTMLELDRAQELKEISNTNYQKCIVKIEDLNDQIKTLESSKTQCIPSPEIQLCLEEKSMECDKLKSDLAVAKQFIIAIRNELGLESNPQDDDFDLSACHLEKETEQIKLWIDLIKKKIEQNKKNIHSLSSQLRKIKINKALYFRGNKLLRLKLKKLRKNIVTLRAKVNDIEVYYGGATSLEETPVEYRTKSLVDVFPTNGFQELQLKNSALGEQIMQEKQLNESLALRNDKLESECQRLSCLLKQEHTEASRQLELQLAMFCSTAERYREQLKRIEEGDIVH